ncbi:hypothetical protein [Bacteriovorax sp. Seq25_V]|uniref:hypothetical protein n=1 Tax=Bacteriovorax sp. Seq25_V TaxID=1201288 RepID=UPI000389FB56|nr:hypothetical protein [Bacteriovorax sp. Seq25_V]EQC43859.1 hypothetical protein M900_1518 [Bacteriovorax sp. Seq25_V]
MIKFLGVFLISIPIFAGYCQTKHQGKRYFESNDVGFSTKTEAECSTKCEYHRDRFLSREDGPRIYSCYYDSKKLWSHGTLPDHKECVVIWNESGEVFKRYRAQTKSICEDLTRTNVDFLLNQNFRKTGYHVNYLFDGEKFRERKENPECQITVYGTTIVRHPGMTTYNYEDSSQCIDKCSDYYQRYTDEANGDPREVRCNWGGKEIEKFGDISKSEKCQVYIPSSDEIYSTRFFPTRSMCNDNFKQNELFKLENYKFKNKKFHVQLFFNEKEIINDYYHKISCRAKIYGTQPNGTGAATFIYSKDDCINFCKYEHDRETSRANGESRWTHCIHGDEIITKLGEEPESQTCKFFNREDNLQVSRTFYAKTPSLCKYTFNYQKSGFIDQFDQEKEFILDIFLGENLVDTYINKAICRSKVSVKEKGKFERKLTSEDISSCKIACQTEEQRLQNHFKTNETTQQCFYASELIE